MGTNRKSRFVKAAATATYSPPLIFDASVNKRERWNNATLMQNVQLNAKVNLLPNNPPGF